MKTNMHSPGILRKRKMLLLLPALIIPFITLGFWALGGGGSAPSHTTTPDQGLNTELPDPKLNEENRMDKLSFYEKAESDSAKLLDRMRNDPYFKIGNLSGKSDTELDDSSALLIGHPKDLYKDQLEHSSRIYHPTPDENEARILKKLKTLNNEMDKNMNPGKSPEEPLYSYTQRLNNSPDLNSLEKREPSGEENQQVMEGESNPELNQLNGMLEKILDIQHPERLGNRLQQESIEKQEQVFQVTNPENFSPITLLENQAIKEKDSSSQKPGKGTTNSFYGLTDNNPSEIQEQNTLRATIHESQTIVSGSVIKLRTVNDMYINGILIPSMHFIYGMAHLSEERLKIEIKSIRYKDNILPVNLSVYDLDGMEGIFIPGAIARNSTKESTDKALQSIALNSLDPSVGTQAASVGIEAAKSFLSKKVKLIKVSLKPGYQVLLKENRNQ